MGWYASIKGTKKVILQGLESFNLSSVYRLAQPDFSTRFIQFAALERVAFFLSLETQIIALKQRQHFLTTNFRNDNSERFSGVFCWLAD